MLRPLGAVAALLLLAGCATGTPQADPRAVVAQGCEAYGDALNAAAHARDAGDLSAEAIEAVTVIRHTVGPICEQQDAYDPVTAAEIVRQGVLELARIRLEAGE